MSGVSADEQHNAATSADAEFSSNMKKEFLLREDMTFLNHGSYGAVPKTVFHAAHQARIKQEQAPDLYFRCDSVHTHTHIYYILSSYTHMH